MQVVAKDKKGVRGLTPLRALLLGGIALIFGLSLDHAWGSGLGRIGRYAEEKLLGRGRVAPELKVFVMDEPSRDHFGTDSPGVDTWTAALNAIVKRQPKAVVLVNVFDWRNKRPYGDWLDDLVLQWKERKPFKIYTDVNLTPDVGAKNQNRDTVAADGQTYIVYGPAPEFDRAFDGVGHTLTDDLELPRQRLSLQSGQMLGYLNDWAGALAGKGTSLTQSPRRALGRLAADGKTVYSLRDAFEANRVGHPLASVMDGDVVAIFGSARLFGSTHERQETLAESLNATLTGEGGISLPFNALWHVLFAVGASFAAYALSRRSIAALLPVAFVVPLLGIGLSAAGIVCGWVGWSVTSLLVVLAALMDRYLTKRDQHVVARRAIERHLPDGQLGPSSVFRPLELASRRQDATVVALELEGYSLLEARAAASGVFDEIEALYEGVRSQIHEHGGIVARLAGDEIIAVFGVSLGERPTTGNSHVHSALQAAIAAQKAMLAHHAEAEADAAICPLKIGVATGEVTVGVLELGLSVAGTALREAIRCRDHCRGQHIVVTADTFAAWRPSGAEDLACFTEKLVRNGPDQSFASIFEYDPYFLDRERYQASEQKFLQASGIRRAADRMSLPASLKIDVETEVASGQLVDFSSSGIAVNLKRCLMQGQRIDLRLKASDKAVNGMLEDLGINELVGEVKWGRKRGESFVHGISLINLSKTQKDNLVAILTSRNSAIQAA